MSLFPRCESLKITTSIPSFLATEGKGPLATETYYLHQFHVHFPSEHAINGSISDGEIHLVHKNANDKIMVIGARLKIPTDCADDCVAPNNRPLQSLNNRKVYKVQKQVDPENLRRISSTSNLPQNVISRIIDIIDEGVRAQKGTVSSEYMVVNSTNPLNPYKFLVTTLEGNLNSYLYLGSLTTPPCTQGVSWVVLEKPIIVPGSIRKILRAIKTYPNSILNENIVQHIGKKDKSSSKFPSSLPHKSKKAKTLVKEDTSNKASML